MSKNINKHDESEIPYSIFSSPIGMRHDVYLSEEIGEPSQYSRLIGLLRELNSTDCCNIFLNNGGGWVTTGVQLISAIKSSNGHVRTIVEGQANSMAALIFMAGHELTIGDHSTIMFHNISCGFGGKGHEVLAHATATTSWFDEITKDLTIPFLNSTETDKILSGTEFYLNTKEIRERFKNIGEISPDGSSVLKFTTLERWDPDYERPNVVAPEIEEVVVPVVKKRNKK